MNLLDLFEMGAADVPPSLRRPLTVQTAKQSRTPARFLVTPTSPDYDTKEFADQRSAQQYAKLVNGRIDSLDEGEVTPTAKGLKHRATDAYGADYNSQGIELSKQKDHADMEKVNKTLTKNLEKGMDVSFKENSPEVTERKGSSARLERMLTILRAKYPQAQDELEALMLNFANGQKQDRQDINRLDAENDQEDAEIDQLQNQISKIAENKDLWKRAVMVAESKFNASNITSNLWATKWYRAHGGTWNKQ